jgi:hypothetical protein
MTTPRKVAANGRNAQKSTGPRTEEGKRRSSRNALKHGLTANEIVLPNEDPGAFDERLTEWNDYFRPENPAQAAVIDRAVAAKWKLDRCTRVETQRLSEKVRHAVDRYDLDKLTEVEDIGRRLIYEPINRCEPAQIHDPVVRERLQARADANPAVLVRQLQSTAQGVQWLIDRWLELAEMLKLHGFWHYPEKFKAIWMLGKRPEDVLEDVTVQRIFLACNIAHPDCSDTNPDSFNFWDECFQAKLGMPGKPMYFYQIEQISTLRPPDVETARARLWEFFTVEIARLRKLKEEQLDPIDRIDRATAPDRAMFDGSKEGVLLRRYETACEREFHKSIADLMKLEKGRGEGERAPAETAEVEEAAPEPSPEPAARQSVEPRRRSARVAPRNEPRPGPSSDPRPPKDGEPHAGQVPIKV